MSKIQGGQGRSNQNLENDCTGMAIVWAIGLALLLGCAAAKAVML